MIRTAHVALALSLLGGIVGLDERVQSAVQSGRTPAGDRVMRAATDLGRRDILAWGLVAIAILDGARGPATVRLAVASLVAANLVVEGGRRAVGRPRPDGERRRSNSSFPSGHAASAAGLAVIFARRWKRLAPGFWVLAGLVSFSRIYLNRHFLSDVVCGVAIGIACAWLVLRLWPARRLETAGRD